MGLVVVLFRVCRFQDSDCPACFGQLDRGNYEVGSIWLHDSYTHDNTNFGQPKRQGRENCGPS